MDSKTLTQHSLVGQHFGYSASDIGDLGATEYTLVTIVVDESGSVSGFKKKIETCIKEIVNACKKSPRADYLLIRIVAFNSSAREIHGFKQLIDCNINDYDGCISPTGSTLLFETANNAITATADYGKTLADNDFDVNAIIFILTDGEDNVSVKIGPKEIGKTVQKIVKGEFLESIMTFLVGIGCDSNNPHDPLTQSLEGFKTDAGFDQFLAIDSATDKNIAKLANFISKSISSQSASLGSGGKSQILTF